MVSREELTKLVKNYLAWKYQIVYNYSSLSNEDLEEHFGTMLTIYDLMKLFNIKRDAIMGYVKNGKLKGAKIGNAWRFYSGDVVDFWEKLVQKNSNYVPDTILERYGSPPPVGKAGQGGRGGRGRKRNI